MKLGYRILSIILYCIFGFLLIFPLAFVAYLKSIKIMWKEMKVKQPKITEQEVNKIVNALKKSIESIPQKPEKTNVAKWSDVPIFYNRDGNS